MFRDLYYGKTTIDQAKIIQEELDVVLNALKNYAQRNNKYAKAKNKPLNNPKNLYKGREKIIEGFKKEIFPLYCNELYKYQMKEEKEEQDKKPFDPNEVIEWMINREKAPINNELINKHFKVQEPIIMYKVLYETNDKEKIVN